MKVQIILLFSILSFSSFCEDSSNVGQVNTSGNDVTGIGSCTGPHCNINNFPKSSEPLDIEVSTSETTDG